MSKLDDNIPSYMPRWRQAKDAIATVTITAGGASVLLAILLIFFYLLYEVLPLFSGGSIVAGQQFQGSEAVQAPQYLALEEQGEVAIAIDNTSHAVFFSTDDGGLIQRIDLAGSYGPVVTVAPEAAESRLLALGHSNGAVSLVKHEYRLTYPDGERVITPRLDRLYEQVPIALGNSAIVRLAVRDSEDALVVAGILQTGKIAALRFTKEEDFLSGEVELVPETLRLPGIPEGTHALYIGSSQRWLYLLGNDGAYTVLDLNGSTEQGLLPVADSGVLFNEDGILSASGMLLGGISLLAGSNTGELAQFFMVRADSGYKLQRVRSFDSAGEVVTQLIPEHRRKGFMALTSKGGLAIYHTTAQRKILHTRVGAGQAVANAALSPRGNFVLLVDSAVKFSVWDLDNEHPDVSWAALWEEVWYESYDEPQYVWQSSASDNDFEPKYSFSPLAFGTLKAAFYTMLIAAPLAICGAIFTAYFMAPTLRRKIKPLIELMEALPTVILGFLAGLWLAPFVEDNLTGVFTILLVLPIGILLFAFLWSRLPLSFRARVPDGWQAAVLIPVVIALGYLSFAGNDTVELLLFDGDMRIWVTSELGIAFDQRNALVVGVAMGMAVIPTIYSIAEDAIFSVPRHLSYGSLALGATPWQTLVGVVLPTASPGIFSGMMIGMGRAVGETMIVLMATGNTPIMDANIFEGMRTLSANIAVEIPEAEVDSSHYRVLFLAAFVLFLFTFVVNTAAELIRQRLRIKYGSL